MLLKTNSRGTVNRGYLRKLIEAGQVEARLWYRYDDQEGTTLIKDEWFPACISTGTNVPGHQDPEGHIALPADSFRDYGRCYINDDGRIIFRIHSNLMYELRGALKPRPGTTQKWPSEQVATRVATYDQRIHEAMNFCEYAKSAQERGDNKLAHEHVRTAIGLLELVELGIRPTHPPPSDPVSKILNRPALAKVTVLR
jgi:hypothetical protein